MFDVGFSELMVIAIVALVVIGPERLPKVARTAGLLFGRLQRYVNDVKSDISREIQLDELKRLQADMQASAHAFERSMKEGIQSVEQSVGEVVDTARTGLGELQSSVEQPSEAAPEAPAETPPAIQVAATDPTVPSETTPKA
ncbi:Sec-independent protein translocase protein TatB [Propionivibrio dicarboxylicus]|uniref:Sec-independent protein translocase protein TatB n=1 Tax=Propionivibrio dicarboxylicus TaxID=83767 RepID=A0A1G8FQ62_9RHOO|nr:Sec-independent protein translocase protein TatB [Propionivibrio dicarboxylicus]SDH84308.1 sec-independent protein translocase protein TatB [Propionivibrio dicarboxylicus]